jgi:predicted TIM-barrel fold metal-dependent hydrolase
MNMKKYAFDSHLHFLPLKYVCLSSYLTFFDQHKIEESYAVLFSPNYAWKGLLQKKSPLFNLISVMENDVTGIAMLLEDDLRGKFLPPSDISPVLPDAGLTAPWGTYEHLVLTPLMMDFEVPDSVPGVFYRRNANHNVFDQAADTVESIRVFRKQRPDSKIIIRPYMGLNTKYHSPGEISALLETCFSPKQGWSPFADDAEHSWNKLRKAKPVRQFRDIPKNTFGGIKVYPPLGFDPWPDDPGERAKVEMLYRFCERYGVPITTHCDDQGFRIITQEESMRQISPERWEMVLEQFPELYLNLAHFGKQYYKGWLFKPGIVWQEKITELLIRYPHVYSDFSFTGVSPDAWSEVTVLLENMKSREAEIVSSKLLFGTDWPLCLWLSESATACWRMFLDSAAINATGAAIDTTGAAIDTTGTDPVLQDKMLSENPMRFHFRAKR